MGATGFASLTEDIPRAAGGGKEPVHFVPNPAIGRVVAAALAKAVDPAGERVVVASTNRGSSTTRMRRIIVAGRRAA